MQKLLSAAAAAAALLALPLAAQATVYQFNASLNGAQQVPVNAATGTGVATLSYNDFGTLSTADDTFNFSLGVFGLTGTATGAHIHAAALAGFNAGVVVDLGAAPFAALNGGGTLLIGGNNVPVVDTSLLSNLQASKAYVNVHTALNPGGEIRGQLIQVAAVPEPSTYAMLAAGLGLVGFVARRRSGSKAR
ncbi:hypothetical protein BH11PSE10_BH11PSE10_20050 [soil metagenome]